jgi:ABC-type transporter Mla MlaB component
MKNNTCVPANEFRTEGKAENSRSVSFFCNGNMTVCNARTLLKEFQNTLCEYSRMSIDLSGVTKIDSSAIQLMIIAKRESLIRKKVLNFINPSNEVVKIFNSRGLSHYIED